LHAATNAFVATWGISFNETSNITHNALLMNKKGKKRFLFPIIPTTLPLHLQQIVKGCISIIK
jgi:hypothetical protein